MATCANCGRETFHYNLSGGNAFCIPRCRLSGAVRGKRTFPFTTENLSGRPGEKITVNSLTHLRKLEREHGVQSSAYNNEEKNWSAPQDDPRRREHQPIIR